jgi:hypothetical protein
MTLLKMFLRAWRNEVFIIGAVLLIGSLFV